jgi:hypothetical protein
MARTQQQQFSTIRTEGALLPPDVLQQIASGKAEGLRPADYHLPEGYKLNEAITQSWDLLKKHWKTFQEARAALSDTDTGTEITNKHWLLPLFRELDYGHLATSPAPQIEDRSYPIERFYNHTPIRLVGCNLPLDRRTKGARGAATASPHSMVQEFLNRSEGHVWAIVTNGLRLRLLRDNVALSRQAFVEFDLEAMMEGEVYPDFALLWLLLHQSRVEAAKPDDCWLEAWSKLARESGTRILKQLRESVRTAIEALGQGFVSHVRNDALREKLRSGTLSRDDFYRQLLRIVYRLLFLFVAEDRDLLHVPATSDTTRDRYRRFYSLSRLRDMALKLRGSKHGDLWHGLSLVFTALGSSDGCQTLGLTGLGSFLWTPAKTPDLNGPHEAADGRIAVEISNDDLLAAVRALAYVEQDGILRSVDYRNLGSEELGSVYESLLELHPDIEIDAQRFSLATAAGNQRKTSGSYYTPDSLVQCLLDSALDPVVEDRIKGKKGADAEAAILGLTVCDPACGSGHFLIAAAHRLARHVARIRTGESEPSPDDHQTALRDVISRCIYGVDLNPMAVELCKVSLWMEAIEPGKPLSFLDHHIKCGNSLLGVTPRLLREGIPEDAFKAIEGDDKDVVKDLKKRHKQELKDRTGGVQSYLFTPYLKLGNLGEEFVRVTTDPSDTAADVARKASLYADLVGRADYLNAKLLADTWCSAFVWKKDKTDLGKACPTERDFRECETNPHSLLPHVRTEVARLAGDYSFFHWHLAFPEVFALPAEGKQPENEQMGWDGGFDVMLGNPPWEHIELKEKEWFADRDDAIANARTGAVRKRLIEELATANPTLHNAYTTAKSALDAARHFISASNRFPLCGRGRVNLYTVFTELFRDTLDAEGRTGCIVPSGIATDDTTKYFFQTLVDRKALVSFLDFENKLLIFPGIAPVLKFCALTIAGAAVQCPAARFVFFLHRVSDIAESHRSFTLSSDDISLLNPNTRTCPIFRTNRDAEITKSIYRRIPVLNVELKGKESNPWGVSFKQGLFNMASDSHLFHTREDLEADGWQLVGNVFEKHGERFFPLLESKLVHHFDTRLNTFDGIGRGDRFKTRAPTNRLSNKQLANPYVACVPRYWVAAKETLAAADGLSVPLLLFRDMTNVMTNARNATFAATGLVAVGHSSPLCCVSAEVPWQVLIGCLNSFVCDYVVRQKLAGAHLTFFILRQIAVPVPSAYKSLHWMIPSVNELSQTAVSSLLRGHLYRWAPARRFQIRCELDAAFFHLYGIGRDDVDYIMDTFPIVKRKDVAKYGSYRTKERILAIYDEMAECIAKGTEWKSPLDPRPGDPRAAWTDEEMEMWRAGRGDELIERYGLLDDADEPDDSDAESEDPTDAEAEAVGSDE